MKRITDEEIRTLSIPDKYDREMAIAVTVADFQLQADKEAVKSSKEKIAVWFIRSNIVATYVSGEKYADQIIKLLVEEE